MTDFAFHSYSDFISHFMSPRGKLWIDRGRISPELKEGRVYPITLGPLTPSLKTTIIANSSGKGEALFTYLKSL